MLQGSPETATLLAELVSYYFHTGGVLGPEEEYLQATKRVRGTNSRPTKNASQVLAVVFSAFVTLVSLDGIKKKGSVAKVSFLVGLVTR